MARASSRTASAPRAGWSAAMSSSRPSSLGRLAAAARRPGGGHGIRLGDAARGEAGGVDGGHAVAPSIRSSTSRSVGIAVEHSRRDATMAPALLAKRRVRSRSQPSSSPWQKAPPKASPAPEAVGDLDRHRRHDEPFTRRGHREHALGPLLDDGELDPAVEQRLGGVLGVVGAHGDAALLEVSDGHRARRDGGAGGAGRLGLVAPELRAVVEVDDRVGAAAAQLPGGGVRRAARLGGQAGEGGPEQPALAHGHRGDLLGRHPQVGRLRVAVEVEREVVGREDLAERHRGRQRRVDGDVGRVDPELGERAGDEAAEGVVAGAADQRAVWPSRATATATLPALPPRNLPKVVTSSSDLPVCIGYRSTPTRPMASTSKERVSGSGTAPPRGAGSRWGMASGRCSKAAARRGLLSTFVRTFDISHCWTCLPHTLGAVHVIPVTIDRSSPVPALPPAGRAAHGIHRGRPAPAGRPVRERAGPRRAPRPVPPDRAARHRRARLPRPARAPSRASAPPSPARSSTVVTS